MSAAKSGSRTSSIFDILISDDEDGTLNQDQDELDRYLKTDVDCEVGDPLLWWVEHKHVYPRLSRMALDFLTVPGKF